MNPSRNNRRDEGQAFIPEGSTRGTDADFLAGEFLASATAGEASEMDAGDEVTDEEWGGPFLEVDAEDGEDTEVIPQPPRLHELPPTLR